MKVTVETAIRNAEASLRMEGMQPSQEVLRECKRVLDGETTHDQYILNLIEQFAEGESGTVQT